MPHTRRRQEFLKLFAESASMLETPFSVPIGVHLYLDASALVASMGRHRRRIRFSDCIGWWTRTVTLSRGHRCDITPDHEVTLRVAIRIQDHAISLWGETWRPEIRPRMAAPR